MISRRGFLKNAGLGGIALSATHFVSTAEARGHTVSLSKQKFVSIDAKKVNLNVNGQAYTLMLDRHTTLLDCLREKIHLTGTKKGCDHGQCGACKIRINSE